jgi:hypothetical protein
MKKLLSLALAVILVLAIPSTAFARPLQMPQSYDFTFEMNFGLDVVAPPEIMRELAPIMPFLQDVAISGTGTGVMEPESFMAVNIHMEMEVTAGIFYIPFTMWMDMDLRDSNNPVYVIVVEVPEMFRSMAAMADPNFNMQYWVLDYAPLFMLQDLSASMEYSMAMVGDILEMMPEMESAGENRYRMVGTDQWLTDLFLMAFDIGIETSPVPLTEADLAEVELVREIVRRGTILPEDWVTYVTLNEDGYTIQEDSSGTIVFNLLEWAAIAADVLEDPSIMADVPEVIVTLTFEYSYTYENINTATSVPLPALTPENSFDLLTELMPVFAMLG